MNVQELIEGLEPFLADYLTTWDGEAHRDVIFDLIALQKPLAYDGEHLSPSLRERNADPPSPAVFGGHILAPLQALAVTANAEWLARLIQCMQELVLAWAMRTEWGKDEL